MQATNINMVPRAAWPTDINRDSGCLRLHLGHPSVAQNQDDHAAGQHVAGLSQSASSRLLHTALLALLDNDMFSHPPQASLTPVTTTVYSSISLHHLLTALFHYLSHLSTEYSFILVALETNICIVIY